MTATTPKTKRDRAAGRHHRHTAIQTIKDNHQGIIDDIASIDNSIASLQDETCNLGSRLDAYYDRLNQADENNIACVAHAMQRIARNERKQAEVESAVAILQHTSAEHREAIAQLIAYTNKVHGKQTNLNRELNLTRAAVDEVRDDLMWFGRLLIGLSATTILAYVFLFLIVIVR